MLHISNANF